jgi:hypothetical protein
MNPPPRDGVIPNARVFTSGRRDLAWNFTNLKQIAPLPQNIAITHFPPNELH